MRFALFLTASIVVFTARAGAAQTATGLDLLAIPAGQPMKCEVVTRQSSTARSAQALVRRRFLVGPPSPAGLPLREITVAYDSGGRLASLSDEVSPPFQGSRTAVVAIRPDGQMLGRRIDVGLDSTKVAQALASGEPAPASQAGLTQRPATRELQAAELAQARALAVWLWPRRCDAAG